MTDAGDIDRSHGQSSADPHRLLQLSPVWSSVVTTQQTPSSHQCCGSSHPLGTSMRPYITPLLVQLHWLRVPGRIEYKLCVMVYRCLHGVAPDYFASCQ